MANCILTVGGPWYYYGGYKFEMHHYCGPALLREDGELQQDGFIPPRSRFWKAFEFWQELPQTEKDKTQISLIGRRTWVFAESGRPVPSK